MRASHAVIVAGFIVTIACSSTEGGTTPTDGGVAQDSSTTPEDGGTDANPTDSASADTGTDSSSGDACNGCVKGPVGNGTDTITLATVTGIQDGLADPVVVTGTYTLNTAATATLTSTCEGQSSGERKAVTGGNASYTLNVDFQNCATDIVKVTLFPPGQSSSNNYVKCCFKKGRDF